MVSIFKYVLISCIVLSCFLLMVVAEDFETSSEPVPMIDTTPPPYIAAKPYYTAKILPIPKEEPVITNCHTLEDGKEYCDEIIDTKPLPYIPAKPYYTAKILPVPKEEPRPEPVETCDEEGQCHTETVIDTTPPPYIPAKPKYDKVTPK